MSLTPEPSTSAPPAPGGKGGAEGKSSSSIFPLPSFLLYLLPLAGYWLVLIYQLGAQWSVYEQYNYGWAVPVLCLYLLWRKVAQVSPLTDSASARDASAADLRPLTSASFCRPSSIFYLLFIFLALAYAPTRFLHEANPTWRLTSLLWTLEVIGLTLLVIRLALGARRLAQLAFAVCFFLVAVPWPSGLENLLTQSLMRLNTAATVELLGLFGVPAIQHGNVIEVGTGVVGIDEACSGIRSLQATLMISLFLGELYALSVRRRGLCVFAGFAFAFVFNVGRTLLLTRVASAKGVAAVASWHDPAGVTILVACFLSVWLFARALQKAESRKQKAEMEAVGRPDYGSTGPGDQETVAGVQSSKWDVRRARLSSLSHLRWVSWFLLAWLLLVEAGTELWYRSRERATATNIEWSVKFPQQSATYKAFEIPPSIRGQFRCDEGTQARWQDGSGNSWQLYYFRWFPTHSLQKRVANQLAKTHGPEKCLPAAGMSLSSYVGVITVPIGGLELAMQQYVFSAEGRPFHVFYAIYEDPSGSAELANRRRDCASRVAAALAGSRNYGQRFLEVAVAGYERPEDARAALVQELGKVIKVAR